jgi:uncharacterized protein
MPPYEAIQQALEQGAVPLGAAECHGMLAGLLCMSRSVEEHWPDAVLVEMEQSAGGATEELHDALEALLVETREALSGDGFGFAPLLPDDDQPLAQRSTALGQWCTGFLYGLGLGGLEREAEHPEEVVEALADLAEITRAALGEQELEDEDDAPERDYAELVEYVRVAVMLIHESQVREE